MRVFGIAWGRLALAMMALGAGGAEALTYSWKPSTAAYATVSGTPIGLSAADDAAVLVTLPFTFTFDSVSYTSVGVSTNGILTLGTTSTSYSNPDLFNNVNAPFNVLAPWWDDLSLDASGTVQSFTEGTAPNRDFVIQYGNYPDYRGAAFRLNWQVRLYEGSNRIQFAYGSKSAGTPSASSSASVGIKGKNGLTGFFIDGTTGSRTVGNPALNSNTGFPAAGSVFTFAPDTAAPLGLAGTAGSGRIDLSWQRTRLTSLVRYRIWVGTSPAAMTPRDSTASLTDTTRALTGLVNGTPYYIGVTVVGPGGEESGFAQVISVTPTLPPTVSIATPTSGAVYAQNGSITFTASASDPDGSIARVEYYRGGNILIGSSTLGSTYSYTWSPLVAGSQTITARAYDNSGASATSAPITVIVDVPPTVSLTAPATGTVVAPGSDVNLTATASDADGSVARVEFLRDGILLGSDATSPYAFTWTAVTAGRYTLTARAVDDRGIATTSSSVILSVTTPPTISIASPVAGSVVQSSGGLITLTANASDADGTVSQVDYYRGATFVGSSTLGNPFTVNATAVTGAWSLTARATDNFGATATSAAVSFTVNLAPSVSLSSPLAGSYALGTTFNLAASASDADGSIALVEFFRDGVKIGEANSAPFGIPWTPDTAGRYILTVRATDNSGGISTSSPVTLNLSRPPVVRFTHPVSGGSLIYPQDTLTVAAMDSDGTVSRVDYYSGTLFLGSVATGNPFRFTWNIPSQGSYTLIARAYDNLGVTGKPDTVLVEAHSAPQVTLTSPAYFSAFATGAPIALAASVVPAGRPVSQVRFYRDSVLIGTSSGPAYGATWANPPPGRYRLQALAEDDRGIIGYSQPVTVFVNDSAKAIMGGRLFISGHDADDHGNYEFLSAGLDYLLFGKAAETRDQPVKKGARVAFLYDSRAFPYPILDYGVATGINVSQSGWEALAFPPRPYDALIIGSGVDYVSGTGSTAINTQRAKFQDYFNRGGGIMVLTEQGLGQSYYDFLPTFGSARQQALPGGGQQGVFTATPAGLAIGLTEAIVDRDLTHTEFLDVDTTVFRTFEYYNGDHMPVSIGVNGIIQGGGYVPQDSVVADPQAFARDTVFLDTLCVRFQSPTAGAVLYLTRDGGNPDTSSWTLANGGSVCIDNSTRFLVIAKKPGWLNSATKEFRYRRADQVAMPLPDIPPGYFQTQVCVRFTSATAGAEVRYTLDGGRPDTSSRFKANGDSVCLDSSRVIRVLGRKTGMRDSDTGSYAYTRMVKTAKPALDMPDSTWFPDSLCFRFSAAPGSEIHYTLDGGDPDTVETHAHNGESLCVDRTVTVRLIAKQTNFIPSDENAYRYFKMDTVAAPVSNRADSTWFRDTLCLTLASATPGAVIHYTLDGSLPDTTSPVPAGGGLCVDHTVRLLAFAVRKNWVNSPFRSYNYVKMATLAAPAANPPDSTAFSGSLCVRFSTNTDGATLRYSLDGSDPAGSTLLLPMSDSLCVDRALTIRARAEKTNWIQSPAASFTYRLLLRVDRPTASRGDSTWFADTACVRFATATDSATLHYLLGPGRADTSSLVIPQGRNLCVDRNVEVTVAATRPGWLPSAERVVRFFKMDTAAVPTADPGDSTWFAGRQCIRLSTTTAGAGIRYTADGGDPAVAGIPLAAGDTVCVEDTATVRALARKPNWVDSRPAVFHYIRMRKVATPTADRRDSTYFADSLCVRFATATAGAALRYTVDGSMPDGASPVLPDGGTLCVDRTAALRVIGTEDHWIPSEAVQVRVLKMDTVARPVPQPGDSAYFPQSLCVRWTVATPGAVIRVTTDGSMPDSSSRALNSGDTLCLDRTATLRAVGTKPDWIPSPDTAAVFLRMQRAAKPTADQADSTYFPDRLCIRYASATEGARILYAFDGGRADTSSLSIANGDTLCVDRSARIDVAAARKNWITSDDLALDVFRMRTVAVPEAGVPDSTWFRDSLCVPWTTATPGAAITVREAFLDGVGKSAGAADSLGTVLASGDSVCLDRSAALRAVGSLKHWQDSPEAVRSYFRMDTVAKPVFSLPDTVFYPSICVKVSTGTPGADIRYTTDGGDPDTSRTVKREGDTLCVDRSSRIRAIGEREHAVKSAEADLRLEKMPQIAPLVSSIGDSAVFAHRLCFTLSSATDSIRIRYTLGGGDPLRDTLSMAGGDTLCLDRSAQVVAVGTRPLWRNSPEIRISLEVDNDGPRLVKAEKRPYDIQNLAVTGNCRGVGQDTLKVVFSERLFPKSKPPRWDRLLTFSPSCDSGDGLPVRPAGDPVVSADGLEATLLLDNASSDEKPKLGNCLSLDWRSGEFPDRVGNPPLRNGVRIEGRENTARISQIRAYPPIVGLDNAEASRSGCSDEGVQTNTWIPPVGFDVEKGVLDPVKAKDCRPNDDAASGSRAAIPPCMSIVEVVSEGPYVADVKIFDQLGNFIQGSRQRFGACGELDNLQRSVAGKKRSYLVWNTRDRNGARAGNGAYVWRISFQTGETGERGVQTVLVRTGFLRNGVCAE